MEITQEQALQRFPELRELVTLRGAGWKFRLIGHPVTGGLEGVAASYTRQQYTDAIFIYDEHTVVGARVVDDEYGGGTVWSKHDGTLAEVVAELLGLPKPGERAAPYLVKRSSLLWTP